MCGIAVRGGDAYIDWQGSRHGERTMTHGYSVGDEPVPGAGYRLQQFLGRGGFGEVWKAAGPGGTDAALKIIHLGGVEGRKEFRALQLVKRIRHPNLVPITAFWLKSSDGSVLDDSLVKRDDLLSVETQPGQLRETMIAPPDLGRPHAAELIIAMGLGDMNLFDLLQQSRDAGARGIPADELLHYMEGAAAAIDYLNRPVHDMGSGPVAIQHCDIKPHNIMVVGGAAQVCDFGLARAISTVRATTTVAGTVAYAAPECLQAGKPSDSTDQYSLAVTYYELRTGRLPYKAETYAAVTAAILTGSLDFADVSPEEQAALRRATSMDPGARFPSATAMVQELRAACAGRVSLPLPQAPRRWAGQRVAAGLLAGVLLGAVGYGAWLLWPGPTPPPPPPREDGLAKADPVVKPRPKETIVPVVKPKPEIKTPPKPDPLEKAKPFLDRGTELLLAGKYGEAIAELEQAAALAPRSVSAHSRLGSAWFRKGEPKKAVEAFTRAIEIDPDATDYVNRGRAQMDLERFDEAVSDFGRAIGLDAGCAAAYYFRADCRLRQEDFAKAVPDFDLAIELASHQTDLDFELSDAHVFRGYALLAQGRPEPAAKDFSHVIRSQGALRSGDVHGFRADCYEALGNKAAAEADRRIAALVEQLTAKPDDAAALGRLAFALATGPEAEVRSGKEAVDLATRACELAKWNDPACLDALAAAHAEAGQFQDAVTRAQKAVELAPDDGVRAQYRARLELYKSGKPFRASPAPLP